jgi:ketosteroid isomerase-like protein
MSQQNVEIVRRVFDVYTQGGFAAVAEFIHPEFEMRQLANHFLSGTFRGADAAESMTDFMRHFEDFHAQAEAFIDARDDRVVVAIRERGRPRGATIELDQLFGVVYTLREGKIARMEWYDSPADALKAAGLAE